MPRSLFEAYGIELEYMLVDPTTLAVRSVADCFLSQLSANVGAPPSDVTCRDLTWSNELARHVIELKVSEPTADFVGLAERFQNAIVDAQASLHSCGAALLPTAMHPTMKPLDEVQLWPHEGVDVYQQFDAVFDCRSHGWGNVQSVHLNLPFQGDREFAALHAAIRLLLPVLPGLAASSPVADGTESRSASTRLVYYVTHCDVVPCLIGDVIPDPMTTQEEYNHRVFEPIARESQRRNWQDWMKPEFLNARGAIARFDRGSIEIRLMDVQEHPRADVAICAAVIAVLRRLVDQRWRSVSEQNSLDTRALRLLLDQSILDGEDAIIRWPEYLACFGIEDSAVTMSEFWNRLLADAKSEDHALERLYDPLDVILREGTLSKRIRRSLHASQVDSVSLANRIDWVYRRLAHCLQSGHSFLVP
ncbi:glutamate-cysteine ligase family protein [Roseiconus lacunae]|uniref:glutamate-cysteine ligase family protein n=1 Tax=Roseiconus lacunae TaxID=2605694 RepID=UPI001E4D6F7D|nr:glutamate-cysteine ligase family protein [Roseiconus lacunae]MCD0458702.1 glutamate-cysteine ligase family protein [Roseiconus lacunae]